MLEDVKGTVVVKPITIKRLWYLKIDTVPQHREGKRKTGTP